MTSSAPSGSVHVPPTGQSAPDPAISEIEAVMEQMTWTTGAPLDAVGSFLPGALLHDVNSGAWVFDVSEAGPNMDRALIQRIGDPVLVCFGTHPPDECPLDPPPLREGEAHGMVLEAVSGRPADARFVHRLSELVRADLPLRVKMRKPPEDVSLPSPKA